MILIAAGPVIAQTSTQPASRRRTPAVARSVTTTKTATPRVEEQTTASVISAETAAMELSAGETTTTEAGIRIGYAVDVARSWYEFTGGVLSWKDAGAGETNHVIVTVQHDATGRTISGCKVTANLSDSTSKDVASSVPLSFTWGSDFSYYGANFSVPETTDSLTLNVRIEPPEFRRLDKQTGGFFAKAITVSFTNVKITARTRPEKKTDAQPERGAVLEGRHPPVTPTPYPGARETTGPLSP